jgi:hypothetical protein
MALRDWRRRSEQLNRALHAAKNNGRTDRAATRRSLSSGLRNSPRLRVLSVAWFLHGRQNPDLAALAVRIQGRWPCRAYAAAPRSQGTSVR